MARKKSRTAKPAVRRKSITRGEGASLDPQSPYAHGFFSAIVAGPNVLPGVWMPCFIPVNYKDAEEATAAVQSALEAYNQVASMLAESRQEFGRAMLEIARLDTQGDGLKDWGRGFSDAMELNPEEWEHFLNSLQDPKLFGPMVLVWQVTRDPASTDWFEDQQLRENTASALAVLTVRLWEKFRNQPEAYVQVEIQT